MSMTTFKEWMEKKREYDDAYYNGDKPLISDQEYDRFVDEMKTRFPTQLHNQVGCSLRESENRVRLPFYMGSLDKKKDQKSIDTWRKKYSKPSKYICMEKLDGVSLLIKYDGKDVKLYTRGDGIEGADISYLKPHLSRFKEYEANLRVNDPVMIRGELIVSKSEFKKYVEDYSNPRNMVSGIVNAKTLRKGTESIDFIAYQVVDTDIKCSEQLDMLYDLGFETPQYTVLNQLKEDDLKGVLTRFRESSYYCIDGIVICHDSKYSTNTSGNPEHSFCFKMLGETVNTRVTRVRWTLTKTGLYKPTVEFEEVCIEDVKIKNATGFNAKYISDKSIGPGAIISITRSGGVIPYICDVVTQSIPDMPPEDSYTWNDTGVDIIAQNVDVDLKNKRHIIEFFKSLGYRNLGAATVEKIYDNGFNTLEKILSCKPDSFKNIQGLGIKSSAAIFKGIQDKKNTVHLHDFIAASGVLGAGIGAKRVSAILERHPDIFTESKTHTREYYLDLIVKIPGFSHKIGSIIAENIPAAKSAVSKYTTFFNFSKSCESRSVPNTTPTSTKMYRVVLSGFRSDTIKDEGVVTQGIDYVVVKDKTRSTTKTKKAKKLGIPVITLEEFLQL